MRAFALFATLLGASLSGCYVSLAGDYAGAGTLTSASTNGPATSMPGAVRLCAVDRKVFVRVGRSCLLHVKTFGRRFGIMARIDPDQSCTLELPSGNVDLRTADSFATIDTASGANLDTQVTMDLTLAGATTTTPSQYAVYRFTGSLVTPLSPSECQ